MNIHDEVPGRVQLEWTFGDDYSNESHIGTVPFELFYDRSITTITGSYFVLPTKHHTSLVQQDQSYHNQSFANKWNEVVYRLQDLPSEEDFENELTNYPWGATYLNQVFWLGFGSVVKDASLEFEVILPRWENRDLPTVSFSGTDTLTDLEVVVLNKATGMTADNIDIHSSWSHASTLRGYYDRCLSYEAINLESMSLTIGPSQETP